MLSERHHRRPGSTRGRGHWQRQRATALYLGTSLALIASLIACRLAMSASLTTWVIGCLSQNNRVFNRVYAVTRFCAFTQPDWRVPPDYMWDLSTLENYASAGGGFHGVFAAVRETTDKEYHGTYSESRQKFQDDLVLALLKNTTGKSRQSPLLLLTAGAMGVGKSFVVKWLTDTGILPLSEFVVIDPDTIAQRLPEWRSYCRRDPRTASLMTRKESGLITELSLVAALQQRRNILVDSSLRHGSWYAQVLEKVRQELPDVQVVLMYVHSREATIHQRAEERGRGGRIVSGCEVRDSLQKMSVALGRLLPFVDLFVQIANDEDTPHITSVCGRLLDDDINTQDDDEDVDDYCVVVDPESLPGPASDVAWSDVRCVLASANGGVAAEPYPSPPRILPSIKAKELQPLIQLLQTILFAAEKHSGQTRKNPQRTPYVNHPLAVSRTLAEVGVRDLHTLQAALLHDTLEDTLTTSVQLSNAFGEEVRMLVETLTDDDSLRPTTRKLVQLRGAKQLPYKAKLVRIADKLHNVWDILHHGIPGWSQERVEQYVAWACELVNALEGTHVGLERRFHEEVSLPAGYQLGDWERGAAETVGSTGLEWEHLDNLPSESAHEELASSSDTIIHNDLSSLLLAVEFIAQLGDATFLRAIRIVLLMVQSSVLDLVTLQAALLYGACDKERLLSLHEKIQVQFGNKVARTVKLALATLDIPNFDVSPATSTDGDAALAELPLEVKTVLLAEALLDLRDAQRQGLPDENAAAHFRVLLSAAQTRRKLFGVSYNKLEAKLDEVFAGQVRLVSGELAPVLAV